MFHLLFEILDKRYKVLDRNLGPKSTQQREMFAPCMVIDPRQKRFVMLNMQL